MSALAAIQRSADHRYTYQGRTYPGVTSILKILDKSDALMSWAARQTAEAALSQLDSLPSLLFNVGEEGVIKALTSRSTWKRDEAAHLGTEVHTLADALVTVGPTLSGLEDRPQGIRDRVTAYEEWWRLSGWRLRLSEALVVEPDIGYGGTFDLMAYDRDGRTVLADIKTGKGVYREAVLQLAAYGMASVVAALGSPAAFAMPEVDRYVILHVTEKGVREIEVAVTNLERQAFCACIALNEWAETMKGKKL